MSTSLVVAGHRVEVTRKQMRSVRMRIGRDGQLRISAPSHTSDAHLRRFIADNLDWIDTQQRRWAEQADPPLPLRATGELAVFGEPTALHHATGSSCRARLLDHGIELQAPSGTTEEQLWQAIDRMYRAELEPVAAELIDHWARRMQLHPPQLRIRRMVSRWGSCNASARRINLNLELAARPLTLLEMVVVHELMHLEFAGHGPQFRARLSELIPDWQHRNRMLNSVPPPRR